jgi:hypothetical protein
MTRPWAVGSCHPDANGSVLHDSHDSARTAQACDAPPPRVRAAPGERALDPARTWSRSPPGVEWSITEGLALKLDQRLPWDGWVPVDQHLLQVHLQHLHLRRLAEVAKPQLQPEAPNQSAPRHKSERATRVTTTCAHAPNTAIRPALIDDSCSSDFIAGVYGLAHTTEHHVVPQVIYQSSLQMIYRRAAQPNPLPATRDLQRAPLAPSGVRFVLSPRLHPLFEEAQGHNWSARTVQGHAEDLGGWGYPPPRGPELLRALELAYTLEVVASAPSCGDRRALRPHYPRILQRLLIFPSRAPLWSGLRLGLRLRLGLLHRSARCARGSFVARSSQGPQSQGYPARLLCLCVCGGWRVAGGGRAGAGIVGLLTD